MDRPRKSGWSHPTIGVAMSEMENIKNIIVQNIHRLCAHCVNGSEHNCQFKDVERRILELHGVPLIVNNEFRGVLMKRQIN